MASNIDTTQFNDTEVIKLLRTKQELVTDADNVVDEPPKSNRGRKKKYASDEERILARRAQQKAYRERKKKELAELRALKAQIEAQNQK